MKNWNYKGTTKLAQETEQNDKLKVLMESFEESLKSIEFWQFKGLGGRGLCLDCSESAF